MFARFERKSFPWDRAFSYLTQFTQDTAYYVPNNGHLEYEIWGVTDDLKHVIHADFSITHPKLANWGYSVRITRSIKVLKKDQDYKRVESCNPAAFSPSLKSIDALVGSLRKK